MPSALARHVHGCHCGQGLAPLGALCSPVRNSMGGGSRGFDPWVPTSIPMGCGYPVPISMADTDLTLEMTGIHDSQFSVSVSHSSHLDITLLTTSQHA